MESEWNLSDKITKVRHEDIGVLTCECGATHDTQTRWFHPEKMIPEKDVREFIKRLKEFVHEMEAPLKAIYGKAQMEISWKIDKLAGEKLI